MKYRFVLLIAAWMFVQLTPAHAQSVPQEINYQGELLDGSGNPAQGNVTMTVSLFDTKVGGSALYTENQTVTVRRGLFSVNIGSVTPIPEDLFDTSPRFLEIAIDGAPITSRRPLTSAAYAFSSGSNGISTLTAQDGLDGVENAGEITVSIATDGVTSNNIIDGTITGADLGINAVASSEIAAGAVGDSEIANKAVGSDELKNNIDLGEADIADGQLQIFSEVGAGPFRDDPAIALITSALATYNGDGNQATKFNTSSQVITYGISQSFRNVILEGGSGSVRVPPGDILIEGAVRVFDDQSLNRAGIEVTSVVGETGFEALVYGDEKSFRMPHPYVDDQEIWYAALEGPEAAAYLRGTGQLIDGQGLIPFPEHFQLVANAEDMTVRLTPLNAHSTGLAVMTKSPTGIEVRELRDGTGTYNFDWEVKSVRKGHEDFQVERSKSQNTSEK